MVVFHISIERNNNNRAQNSNQSEIKISMNKTGNEESKDEISDDNPQNFVNQSPLSIAGNNHSKGSSPTDNDRDIDSYRNHTEGAAHAESGSDGESYTQCIAQRRTSLIFTSTLDDISFDSLDLQELDEDNNVDASIDGYVE